jgi:hypothetical protein
MYIICTWRYESKKMKIRLYIQYLIYYNNVICIFSIVSMYYPYYLCILPILHLKVCSEHGLMAICSSIILVIHDNTINETKKICLACLCKDYRSHGCIHNKKNHSKNPETKQNNQMTLSDQLTAPGRGQRWALECWRCILVHQACSLHFGLDLIMELTRH